MATDERLIKPRTSLRSPPLVDMRDMYPWAGGAKEVGQQFDENNLDPLGGLNTPSRKPSRRRQTADSGEFGTDAIFGAPPMASQSNSQMKTDLGGQPNDFMNMLNAFVTQFLGGTNYAQNPAAQTVMPMTTPPPPPVGMQIRVAPPPPVPEMNPMMHNTTPEQVALTQHFDQMMQPPAIDPAGMMMAMADAEAAAQMATPNLNPPMPAKKPPAKPQRPADKGKRVEKRETTGAKRASSPPIPKRKPRG